MNNTNVELIAWVGEDERGSGEIGIKQCLVPAGLVPLAGISGHLHKFKRQDIRSAMQAQANAYGKTIRLCRYVFVEELLTIEPKQAPAEDATGLGFTREELRSLFGEPTDWTQITKRRPIPGVWKYGRVEYHFDQDDRVCLIYYEEDNEEHTPHVLGKR